jgi:hypothetical protein
MQGKVVEGGIPENRNQGFLPPRRRVRRGHSRAGGNDKIVYISGFYEIIKVAGLFCPALYILCNSSSAYVA